MAAGFIQYYYNNLTSSHRVSIDSITAIHSINDIYIKTQATAAVVYVNTVFTVLIGMFYCIYLGATHMVRRIQDIVVCYGSC